MTRKRKNVEEPAPSGPSSSVEPNRNFPKKQKDEAMTDYFNKQYGYVGGGGADSVLETALTEPDQKPDTPFPTEIVNYLRNINNLKETESKLEDCAYERCAEECKGEEATLLSFRESCIVLEKVFGDSSLGASLFLCNLGRMKHRRLLDLLFAGCSARTIEKLIFTIAPISTNSQIEILSKLVDLLCDNWADAVCAQPSAFLLRCLARVTCGLPAKKNVGKDGREEVAPKQSFAGQNMKTELRKLYDRMADLAVDPTTTGVLLNNVTCSLVVQEILECDEVAHTGKSTAFVNKAVAAADKKLPPIMSSWEGRESSRVWERAICACAETARRSLWELGLKDKVEDLASHPSANYPFQRFISSIYAEDLVTEVLDVLIPLIPSLIEGKRAGVVVSMIKCTIKHPVLQESLLKSLRAHFKSNKVTNKTHFLFNVLTLNAFDKQHFYVESATYLGSLLVNALLSLSKIKTLSMCIDALTSKQIMDMAQHKVCSHVLQSILRSPTLDDEYKKKIIDTFQGKWEELIENSYGSHIFEAIWDSSLLDVNTKQTMMKSFVPIRNGSKNWKFAMLRCDMMLFRKDRKKWVEKQKKWTTFDKSVATQKK